MMKYVTPEAEIIAFLAKQALATSEETNNDEITLDQPALSMDETVGPWE